MEVLNEKLKQINDKLEEICDSQKDMTKLMAEHEKWINRRDGELDLMDDRFSMIEEQLAQHQTYIDERRPALKEFEVMKGRIEEHQLYIITQKGEKAGVWNLVRDIALLIGVLGGALKLFHVIP